MRVFGSLLVFLLFAAGTAGCSDTNEGDESAETVMLTVPGIAMEPTIMRGQRIRVTKVTAYEPERGEIVIFKDPGGWLTGGEGQGSLVKRVIGVPGDTVTCCDKSGRIAVNGDALKEPYLAAPQFGERCAGAGAGLGCHWTIGPVPASHLFVLGDNRGASADSRAHMCQEDVDNCTKSPWVDIELVTGTVETP